METRKQAYEMPSCIEVNIAGGCICGGSNEYETSLERWQEENILDN